ncbi:hypothetical protein CspeluHIS016_0109660 [Cutaneotrichosporon spelunceum]|uniref:Uncharacterized protein n=1 Tax=Cutaneotrichosporon spelunceum TaxID=1672016 RepID=A0AAD3Y8N0_9TREE|nr:hypothetical protein CspeluHIS016_0109660 [Cutaneotrichosporon spelunceum]
MSLRATTDARYDYRLDLQRSPSRPSLTHTVTTEQSDDQGRTLMTPYTTSLELDATTLDDHDRLLPKGAAPALFAATSTPGSSWGRSSGRSSLRKASNGPPMPSRAIPEFVHHTSASTPASTPAPFPTDSIDNRRSKRISLTRSLLDLRERRAADKARRRNSAVSEQQRMADLPPELPPVPSVPSMYLTAGLSDQTQYKRQLQPRPSHTPMLPSRRNASGQRSGSVPPAPPTPKSSGSGFAGFFRRLVSKKSRADLHVPPPPKPRSHKSGSQPSATRQATSATMPAKGPFGSMGRKTRLDNVPQVETPKAVRGMLAEMKDGSDSLQHRGTNPHKRQSLIRRVPVPTYSMDEFEPIINPSDLPAPPEPPVELEAAAESRADAFARLVGSHVGASSIKSTDSSSSRLVRAPVPPHRSTSPRSKHSTPCSKSVSDVPVTPPPEAMDVFNASRIPIPIMATEVSEEPEPIGYDRSATRASIEIKSVSRFSVSSQVVVIDKDADGGEHHIVSHNSVVALATSPQTAQAKTSHLPKSEIEKGHYGPGRQGNRERPPVAPLNIPVPTVGGSPLILNAQQPKPAQTQPPITPQPFLSESPTDLETFGHGFILPPTLSRENSNNDFHSAYGHGSVFGSDADHGRVPSVRQAIYSGSRSDRQAIYGGSRSDLGHTMAWGPYGASRSDLGHGYSVQTARMYSASASRSDLGHVSYLTQHPFIASANVSRRELSGLRAEFGRSPKTSRSDLGAGRSPMVSQSDLGHTSSPMASRSDLGHGGLRSEIGLSYGWASSRDLRQQSRSENGHGRPLMGKRSVPDLRMTKTPFPDLGQSGSVSRHPLRNASQQARSSSVASHRMPSRQASSGGPSLSRGPSSASRRIGGSKTSYDDFGRFTASSHGHGSVSGHGHDSDDFYSALDHSSMGHGSSWLHEDPRATPTPRTPRTPRTFTAEPVREGSVGDGHSMQSNGSRSTLRSLTHKLSKKSKPPSKQPPTSYDAYAEKQVQLLTRRKSCKPKMHSDASLAAEISEVTDKEDARVMEAVFMA